MSETRFTITLGRTGQVVKRGGSKQCSDGFSSATKRQRVDGFKWSPGGDRFDDSRSTQYDLRLKLMQKRRAEQHRKRDLREKQLKSFQRPAKASMLLHEHQPKGSSLLRPCPSTEILGDPHLNNSMQKYYPSQKHESRVRSPGRTLSSSRRCSPPRTFDGLQQLPVRRAADVSRASRVLSNEVVHASRPTATARTAKPGEPIDHIMLKSSLTGVDPVSSLLHSLGLGKYAVLFKAEEVDMTALKQMGDKDLKELGIPMGPRKKIMLALKPCTKQPPQ
ncbi:hypothetical protein ACOSQ4_029454 [Xanthoceras sorbifolium]